MSRARIPYQPQALVSKAGWVFRDSSGYYHGAGQAIGTMAQNALESELQEIIMAMQHAWCKGLKKGIIDQSDSKKAIDIVNDQFLHFAVYNWK